MRAELRRIRYFKDLQIIRSVHTISEIKYEGLLSNCPVSRPMDVLYYGANSANMLPREILEILNCKHLKLATIWAVTITNHLLDHL